MVFTTIVVLTGVLTGYGLLANLQAIAAFLALLWRDDPVDYNLWTPRCDILNTPIAGKIAFNNL